MARWKPQDDSRRLPSAAPLPVPPGEKVPYAVAGSVDLQSRMARQFVEQVGLSGECLGPAALREDAGLDAPQRRNELRVPIHQFLFEQCNHSWGVRQPSGHVAAG